MVKTGELKKQYIKRILEKEEISQKEALDLILFYKNETSKTLQYSKKDIYNLYLHYKISNKNRLNYILEKSRYHFRVKYNIVPDIHTENILTKSLNENEIVYSKEYVPHVWDGEKFQKIKLFTK